MWTAVSMYFFDFYRDRGHDTASALTWSGLIGFAGIAAGAIGCVVAGAWADRLGRERVAAGAMTVSGACALVIGWLTSAPAWLVVTLALIWGFAVVADSAQFSALVTEVAPSHAVGTALTLQTSLGFLLTAGSIWLMVELQSRFGWGVAFSVLAIGPAYGIMQMYSLKKLRISGNSGMSLSPASAQ